MVTPAVSNLIRENKTYRIDSSMQTGKKYGMQLLDEHLWRLYDTEMVTGDDCIDTCRFPAEFQARIDMKLRGQIGTKVDKLTDEMEADEKPDAEKKQ